MRWFCIHSVEYPPYNIPLYTRPGLEVALTGRLRSRSQTQFGKWYFTMDMIDLTVCWAEWLLAFTVAILALYMNFRHDSWRYLLIRYTTSENGCMGPWIIRTHIFLGHTAIQSPLFDNNEISLFRPTSCSEDNEFYDCMNISFIKT